MKQVWLTQKTTGAFKVVAALQHHESFLTFTLI